MEYAISRSKRGQKPYKFLRDEEDYNPHIPISRCLNEVHTPTSTYLKYVNGWLQTEYDYNNNPKEPDFSPEFLIRNDVM